MIQVSCVTNIGRKRKINQDYVYASEERVGSLQNLFIVADGMGGHNAGECASELAVTTMAKEVALSTETDPEAVLKAAVEKANAMVWKCAQSSPELDGMGTTIVAASCEGCVLSVVNVGDSRLYVEGEDGIRQITRDHSWVEDMVRSGGMAREEARNHPDKNIITRAIGAEETVITDYFRAEIKAGDKILMCTDGLTNMISDEEIRMVLSGAGDISEKAQELVRRANENGGSDNISVILVAPSCGPSGQNG